MGYLMQALWVVLLVVKAFAILDAVRRRPYQFEAAGTLSKQAWLVLLVIALAAHLVWANVLSIFNLAGTVAALVYLAQLRSDPR